MTTLRGPDGHYTAQPVHAHVSSSAFVMRPHTNNTQKWQDISCNNPTLSQWLLYRITGSRLLIHFAVFVYTVLYIFPICIPAYLYAHAIAHAAMLSPLLFINCVATFPHNDDDDNDSVKSLSSILQFTAASGATTTDIMRAGGPVNLMYHVTSL